MRKIAKTSELQHELRRLLAYARGPRPSRGRIAQELEALSARVATLSATPNLDKVIAKDLSPKVKQFSDRLNRVAEKAESKSQSAGDLVRANDIAIKATYELLNLFDPFRRGWSRGEGDALAGLSHVEGTAKSLHTTLQKLEGFYRQMQEYGPSVDVFTQLATEASTCFTLYQQFRRDVGAGHARTAAFYDNTPFKKRQQAMSNQLLAQYLDDVWKAISEREGKDSPAYSLAWIASNEGWSLKVGVHPLKSGPSYTKIEPSDPDFDAARIRIWGRKMAPAA